MKKSNLVMFVIGSALVGGIMGVISYVSKVQAAPAPPVEFESVQTILRCETDSGRTLQVQLENGNHYILNDGVELDTPAYSVVKKTDEMAWSREYNSVQKVNNIEIYFMNGEDNGKLSVTDYGNKVDVDFTVTVDNAETFKDSCKTIERLSLGDELFKDMFYVDE